MTYYPDYFYDSCDRADADAIGPLWSIVSGTAGIRTNAMSGLSSSSVCVAQAVNFSSYDLVAQLTVTALKTDGDLASTCGFILRSTDGLNGILCRYLWAKTTVPDPGNLWTIGPMGGSYFSTLNEVVSLPLVLQVTLQGNTLTFGTDTTVKLSYSFTGAYNPPGTNAYIRCGGGNLGTPTNTRWDNILLTSLDVRPQEVPAMVGGVAADADVTPYTYYKSIRRMTDTYNNLMVGP